MGQEDLERGRERRNIKRRQVEGGRHGTGRFGTRGGKDERLKGDRWREDDMGQEGLERGRERRKVKRRQVERGRHGTGRFGTREGKTKY